MESLVQRLSTLLPPLLADLLAGLLLATFTPWLAQRLSRTNGGNALLLTVAYVLFCVAVALLRRLEGGPRQIDLGRVRRPLIGLAVLFVLFVTFSIVDSWGFLTSVRLINNELMNEAEATTYLLVPAAWFGPALVYVLILTGSTRATLRPGSRRFWLAACLGLIGISLMLAVWQGYWLASWARWQPGGPPALLFLLLFGLFLLLYTPPRLLYVARYPHALSTLTYLLLLAFLAWQVVARA